MNTAELAAAMEYDFEPVVHCMCSWICWITLSVARSTCLVQVRYGHESPRVSLRRAAERPCTIATLGWRHEIRLMTHLASADELDGDTTTHSWTLSRRLPSGFDGDVSIGNTPATLGWPASRGCAAELGFRGDNWIRPGIALFGVSPFADKTGTELGLKPVMQFEARLIAIKPLSDGRRVGYRGAIRAIRIR